MPCYTPCAILFDTSQEPKVQLKYINGHNIENYEFFDKENETYEKYNMPRKWEIVPCLQCEGCQETYSKQWAVKCMLEASQYENNYFLTLTYNDYNIPMDEEIVNKNTGEVIEQDNLTGCLRKRDLQKFFKDLRRYWEYHYNFKGIRFYACGEYGGQTERPHYHAIIFNLPIPLEKLKIHSITKENNIIWECPIIEKIWGKGFISLAEVNWDTCAYVARYVMKKKKGKPAQDYYFEKGQIPEFTLMSRKPGIGREFYNKNFQKIYENDEMIIKGHAEKIQSAKPPKYYDNLFKQNHQEEFAIIKEKRIKGLKEAEKLKAAQTSNNKKERLRIEHETKKAKMNMFKQQRNSF